MTSKNQLTLPKAVVSRFPDARYFEVRAKSGRIVLVPAKITSLKGVWRKIESLGITEKDVEGAVWWARGRKSRVRISSLCFTSRLAVASVQPRP